MLADFQQALADLVASPSRCRAIRADPAGAPFTGYDLTPRERARLVAIARHPGMSANCTVYRSNRLTPLVLNLPDTCAALGPGLREVLDRFWAAHPTDNFVHFLVESDRFAGYLEANPDEVVPAARPPLAREAAVIRARLAETVGGNNAPGAVT
jgi:hypothetical protein